MDETDDPLEAVIFITSYGRILPWKKETKTSLDTL